MLLSGSLVVADVVPRLTTKTGSAISIVAYHPDEDAFVFQLDRETAIGPNYATPEALQKAIDVEGTKEEFIRKMLKDKDVSYVTRKPLPQLKEEEVAARKKKSKAKPKK
jgi:hypothetical protein